MRLKKISVITLSLLIASLTGCVNSNYKIQQRLSSNPTPTGTAFSGDTFKVARVNIVAGSGTSGTGTSANTTSVFFDTTPVAGSTTAVPQISTYCSATAANGAITPKPCQCSFSWQEINSTGATAIPIPRSVVTQVVNVQPNLIECAAPDVYSNDQEIRNGTAIRIVVQAAAGNPGNFQVIPFNHIKNGGSILGSYQDALGQSFDNILEYTCYEQFQRGTSIRSRLIDQPLPSGGNIKVASASEFCVRKANDTGGNVTPGCEALPAAENSAQAYYYNLFIRESERGDISGGNQRYVCPKVKEALGSMGNVALQNNYYPLSSTYSLSIAPSDTFNVGVEAFSRAAGAGDPVATSHGCFDAPGNQGTPADGKSLTRSCMGFAAPPAADGTCPYFRDSTNNIRLTYRLRRYVALYPPVFDTNGAVISQPQAINTVYVLDRPVLAANVDPLKPYTMLGPKPCPFAFFDNKGVTGFLDAGYPNGFLPTYASTNNPRWNNTNIDGIQLPNLDTANSCSAAVPLFNSGSNTFSIGTVHPSNPRYPRLYIRPVQAWAPHYVEDTDFKACAPQATPFRDPPLHFARDTTGNVSYCAETYPSQNDNVTALEFRPDQNTPYVGRVIPYTSHVSKNSASVACLATQPTTTPLAPLYPAANVGAVCTQPVAGTSCLTGAGPDGVIAGVARHPADLQWDTRCDANTLSLASVCSNNTCDRTVVTPGLTWPRFPLLARAPQVEAAMSTDNSYNCMVTYDKGGQKAGKLTPSQGCCGVNVQMFTGVAPNNAAQVQLQTRGAHLEPDAPCLVPQY
jgi:hypothetical protein